MKALVFVVLAALALSAVAMSDRRQKKLKQKFDWNHGTVLEGILTMGSSKMEAPRRLWKGWTRNVYPGGHNFATRRAVDYMIDLLAVKNGPAAAVNAIYQTSLADMRKDLADQSDFVNALVYGNFMNEVRVNIDGEGSYTLSGMAVSLRKAWLPNADISPNGINSEWWSAATGYSSANPIHAMLQEAKPADPKYTQQRSFDLMVAFVKKALTIAVTELRAAKGKGRTAGWLRGVRYIGSVLHTIQDSACTCSSRHRTIQPVAAQWKNDVYLGKLDLVRTCVPGDGHSVVERQGSRFLITGMSNTAFYDARHDWHAQLDMLYENGRLLPISKLVEAGQLAEPEDRKRLNAAYDSDGTVLWGDNDPAYDGGNLIIAVAEYANGNMDPATAAAQMCVKYLQRRYIGPANLKMPPLPR